MTGPEAAQGLARGIHVAATMSIFGSALFQCLVAAPARVANPAGRRLQHRLAMLGWISLAVALLTAIVWLWLQAKAFADGDSIGDILAAVPLILFDTHFGPLLAVRFALLVAACLILGGVVPRNTATLALAATLGAGALELQILLGHGISMPGDARVLLIASELLHLAAAGAWLGGLLPLMLLVAGWAPLDSAPIVRHFSTLGTACVAVLAVTSLVQAWVLIGGLPGLIGTDYGKLALAKLALFVGLLLLAALNRFRLRPRLKGTAGEPARHSLVRSILGESALGLAVVALAGMLLMLSPAIRQQPDWPFRWALDFSRPGILVPANPTSFYRSPTGFTAASIVHGEKLFAQSCAGCHADATTVEAGDRSDGDLFWLLRHGTDGVGAMPGSGDKLASGELWSIIDFLKAEGIAAKQQSTPPFAPDLPVTVDGKTMPLTHLRGQIVRLVAMDKGENEAMLPGTISLRIDPGSDGWHAYATVAGIGETDLRHFTFLIDAAGRLRGVFPPKQDGTPDDTSFAVALTSVVSCGATVPCP
jgi:putative copper export protein/cytochrome c5